MVVRGLTVTDPVTTVNAYSGARFADVLAMGKVKVALLGCGHMAGLHAPSLRTNSDLQVVAGCDVNEGVVNAWIDKHLPDYSPRPRAFSDAATMYRETRPDAVIIITPHAFHFEQGMAALDAGLHVLMEKPMVVNSAQAHKLAARVRQAGKVFVIGYNTPSTPQFHFVREAIRNKTFGNLEMVSGYLAQNWICYTGGTWRQNRQLAGGGEAYDSGAHLLNSLCWSIESHVKEVFAFVDNHGLGVDVNSSINARFENGVVANLLINGNCPVDHGSMSFFFDRGKIDVDGWYARWIKVWHGQTESIPELKSSATNPVDNFIGAILGREEPRTSVMNGVVQSELMDAIYESARTGQIARPARSARAEVRAT